MHPLPRQLLNTAQVELWPAWLLRARANADARTIAQSRWVLRRKSDGGFLAASGPDGLRPLRHAPRAPAGWDAALLALESAEHPAPPQGALPIHGLEERLAQLGLDADAYASASGLALVPEPARLQLADFDRWRRPLWLRADAARAWSRMRAAAARDDVLLEAVSGYRSHDYQLGIFARKRARGLSVAEILAVNAAPGFSEHHSGLALDVSTPGDAPAEESFEATPAFDWLQSHAVMHGFSMSYPRDNPHGIVHEPWHWAYAPGHLAG